MKQVFPRVQELISFGAATTFWPVVAGFTGSVLSSTFGADVAKAPLPWAVTVRNLVVYSRDTSRTQDITVTVLKNGAATGLTVTLPFGSSGPVTIGGPDVVFSQFDDICYRTVTTTATAGWTIAICLELESIGNVFGCLPRPGTIVVGAGSIGGAFGNGTWQPYTTGAPTTLSNTYSICASPGDVTALVLRTYAGVPPVGATWTGWIKLNGVLQDGSGGTVDTTCVMTAGNPTAAATFTLPVVKGDHVDVVVIRTGVDQGFAVASVAAGVGFVPTNADYFMLCGGSNDVIPKPTGYKWNLSLQGLTTEPLALSVVGPSGLVARGLYVERNASPGVGKFCTHTLDRNEAATSIVVTLVDTETTGFVEGLIESYAADATITLGITATVDATVITLHWGLEATIYGVGPGVPGTLIVIKAVTGPTDATLFPIDVGGGLLPAVIDLPDGGSHTYLNVPVATGYSVAETPPAGWVLVGINTDNGSPSSNISVGSGETVTVLVTNLQIPPCPGDRGDPRIDGLPYSPVPVEPCAGTGTRGAPRIGT